MDLGINLEFKKNITIIHVKGDLFMNNVNMFLEVLSNQSRNRSSVIALDFFMLNSLDDLAISRMSSYLQSNKMKLVLYNVNTKINNRLMSSQLTDNVDITTQKKFETEFFGRKH